MTTTAGSERTSPRRGKFSIQSASGGDYVISERSQSVMVGSQTLINKKLGKTYSKP